MYPDTQPQTSKRPPLFWLATGVAGLLIVLVIVLAFFAPQTTTSEVHVKPLALTSPRGIDTYKDQFILTNGRTIVGYNPISGVTEQKMNDTTLPLISTLLMSPDGSKALIQSVTQTTNDSLGQQLAQQHPSVSLEEPYWWIADFQTKTYKLVTLGNGVPVSFRDASWNPDGSGFYALTANGESGSLVYTFSASGVESSNFVTLLTLSFIKGEANGSVITLSETGQLTRYKDNGNTFESLATNASAVAFHPTSPDLAYVVTTQNDSATGYILNTKDKSQHQHEPILESVPVWAADGSAVIANAPQSGGKTLGVMALDGQRGKTFYQPTNATEDLTVHCAVAALSKDLFIGCDEAGRLYIVSKQPVASTGDLQTFTALNEGDITIDYFAADGFFLVSGTGEDMPQLRAIVYDKLRAKGIVPDIADIRFSLQPFQQRFGG